MAEVNILMDVGVVEVDQLVPIALGAVQQGADLLDKDCSPSGVGAAEQLLGLLSRQAQPAQGSADGFTATQTAEPRLHEADQGPQRLTWFGISPGDGRRGCVLLGRADHCAERGRDVWAKRGAATGAPIQQRLGAVFAVAVQQAHHGRRVVAGTGCNVRRATSLCDVMEGKEALVAASMWGCQGQAAQIRQRLSPTFMINS